MMQLQPPPMLPPEQINQIIELLERYKGAMPFADEELARHRALRVALDDQFQRGEAALSAWRAAIARRWECEVNGQRIYSAIRRQICDYFGKDGAYTLLVAPTHPEQASTASDLLAEMRRLEVSLELLRPRPPFADESIARLHASVDDLATAIEWTEHCETDRRSVLIEQRMACNLYQRACDKTRRLIESHMGVHQND